MSLVEVKVNAPSGTIMLTRSEKCNALSREMLTELMQAFSDLHQEKKVRAVILIGSGKHFCAGLDLHQMHQTAQGESQAALSQWHEDWMFLKEVLETMLRFPKPIVSAVDGAALGAGLGLVLASDFVVASDTARLGIPTANRGLISGVVAPLMNFRAGSKTTARMLFSASDIDSSEALRLNLVDEVVKADQVWARAHELAGQCAAAPAEAVQLSKRLLNETIGEELFTQMSVGAAMGATSCTTEAATEGLSAFVEGRGPNWP